MSEPLITDEQFEAFFASLTDEQRAEWNHALGSHEKPDFADIYASGDPVEHQPVCRCCGCTDEAACIDADGRPCHWVAPDLCSKCAESIAAAAAIADQRDSRPGLERVAAGLDRTLPIERGRWCEFESG